MKKLTLAFWTILLLSLLSCRRNRMQIQYERFQEDSTMEFITPPEDTVMIEENGGNENLMDDEELITIPDIPQERSVDMGASDYELERMMSGRGD